MAKPYPAIGYTDYLKTDELLTLQNKRSDEFGVEAHDEMLFIIVHQTYELWFKQILTELDSVLKIFNQNSIDESSLGTAIHRLQRIVEIQKLLVAQVTVLETMTPLDFLEFRDLLYPASGFQSVQNRLIENKLGLKSDQRIAYNSAPYHSYVKENEKGVLINSESEKSLFDLIDAWLARTPFLQTAGFDFWQEFKTAVETAYEEDRETVRRHPNLKPDEKEKNLKGIDEASETFQALFDEKKFEELRQQGLFRISYRGLHAALLIQLYRDQPILHLPFQILTALQDIDELATTWRYRHSLMAHRMLGRKIGTGGSSGAQYLKAATDKHRIFNDFFHLATFFIPRSRLPKLPAEVQKQLGFFYSPGN
ncbi:MAG: tryptophan 2,3-dioxygenase family protein [Bdellovibrionota bacterium]